MWNELRLAVRNLARHRLISVAALVVLCAGMTANGAVFSVLNATLIEPLPYEDPDRLVRVYGHDPQAPDERQALFPAAFSAMAEGSGEVAELAAVVADSDLAFDLRVAGGAPVRVQGAVASANFFQLLRVQPARGRLFFAAGQRPEDEAVAVLSDRLWRTVFGGDPSVVGRTVRLNDEPYQVIGVLPPGLGLYPEAGIWLPNPRRAHEVRNLAIPMQAYYDVYARLAPEIDPAAARDALEGTYTLAAEAFSNSYMAPRLRLVRLRDDLTGDSRETLILLQAAVAVILLLCCTNVAGLFLVQGLERQAEFATRTILGAPASRLVRDLALEQGVLFTAAWLASIGSSAALLSVLTARAPAGWLLESGLRLDWRVAAVTAAVAATCCLVFGLLPASVAVRTDLADTVKGGRARGGNRRGVPTRVLAVGQLALALFLLLSAGLIVRSLQALHDVELGFRPAQAEAFQVTLLRSRYPDQPSRERFFRALNEELLRLPGVSSAGGTQFFFLREGSYENVITRVRSTSGQTDSSRPAEAAFVTEGYLEALGVTLRSGRSFTRETGVRRVPEVVIARSLAHGLWPGGVPAGAEIEFERRWWRVVGMIDDLRLPGPAERPGPRLFMPYALVGLPTGQMTFLVRSFGGPLPSADQIRQAVARVDPAQTVSGLATLDSLVERNVAKQRYAFSVLSLAAAIALLIAGVGVYGVSAFWVAARTRELGVRMAVGASRGRILLEVLGQNLLIGLGGCMLGAVIGVAQLGLVETLLFDIERTDPLAWGGALLLVLGASVAGGLIPALRAARIRPADALRTDR